MPFCLNCRYEYRETARICPKCNAELVAELPPEERRHGFEPTDRVVNWFARRPFWKTWVATARRDIVSFPRFFMRGAAAVFRHPILYLLPLLLFAGHVYMSYRLVSAIASRPGYQSSSGFEPQEQRMSTREAMWQRVFLLPGLFVKAFLQGRAGHLTRSPLPWIPLPPPRVENYGDRNEPGWYESRLVMLAYYVVLFILTAAFQSGMYGWLKSLVHGEEREDFTRAMPRYFLGIAGVLTADVALSHLLPITVYSSRGLPVAPNLLRLTMDVFAFTLAPYAVVVHGVHVHRAIGASVMFVLRHLPAVLVLLVGVTAAESLVVGMLAPVPRYTFADAGLVLRGIPASLLLMLLGLGLWGMMMQWYVEAAKGKLTGGAGEGAPAQVSAG